MTKVPPFTHLHVHSNFSFLDGASSPEALVARAVALGMRSLAITDHDGLYGVVRFHKAAKQLGLRPIIGAEIKLTSGHHLLLLARNRLGYAALCHLISLAHLEHKDDPQVMLEQVASLCSDLFAIIPFQCGELSRCLQSKGSAEALRTLDRYVSLFGRGSVFVELQNHLLPFDGELNDELCSLARRGRVSCVASNNVHYAAEDGYRLQDLMVCIRNGITVDTFHQDRRLNSQYFLKSAEEMSSLFRSYPSAIGAANHIAAACDVDLTATVCRPPRFAVPEGETPFSFLFRLCQEQLPARYKPVTPAAVSQLARELAVIDKLRLAEFFLCVWDICRFATSQGIRFAGRGSAANSIVAYVLGITMVDPIEHNLLFERFLHEELVDRMPDIDIDFDSARREEVIKYVETKYTEHYSAMVANVITYRTRLAVRETAKALGFPISLVNKLSDAAYNLSPHNIDGYLGQVEGSVDEDSLRRMVDLSEELKGCPRHLSLHNGGMLITREPLTSVVPVEISANGVRVCQFNKDDVEALGLIKFDLLGLRNFTIIDEAVGLIRESRGIELPIDELTYDDEATFDMLCSANTVGVFQLESPGQWNLLSRTQPRNFKDIVVEVALFRPGPLQGQMVNPYVARRQGQQQVSYEHPCLESILADTLGVILFQEQVLEIAHVYAGLSYAEADGFRRAISHYRTASEMEGMRDVFCRSADGLGRPPEVTRHLFELLSAYTGYGFCRSHAAAFARTVYQTAYLKTHYPAEFLAAVMSNQPCDFFPPHVVLQEARRLGIGILPIDINASLARYSVEGAGTRIRIGLGQVECLSEDSAKHIVEVRGDRSFSSLEDFYRRADLGKDSIANLIRVGALDGLYRHRRKLLWQLDELVRHLGPKGQRHEVELDLSVPVSEMRDVPALPRMSPMLEVATDYELQGVSARRHPISFYRKALDEAGILSIAELSSIQGKAVSAGIVISKQRPPTAKGMAFFVLADESGNLPVAVKPDVLEKYRALLAEAAALVVEGQVRKSGNVVSLDATRFWPLQSDRASRKPAPASSNDAKIAETDSDRLIRNSGRSRCFY